METESTHGDPWRVQDCCHSATSASTIASVGPNSTPESSIAGSTGCDDDLQISAFDGTTNSTVVDLQDGISVRDDPMSGSKFRCFYLECQGRSFTRDGDLKRHEKNRHDLTAPLLQCGCCQNLGRTYKGNKRKDKVREHLRRQHGTCKPDGRASGIFCLVDGCHTLFTATSCLKEHLRRVHPSHSLETSNQIINGSTCDCKAQAESSRLQSDHQFCTSKHRAGSPLESAAKRGRHHTEMSQYFDLAPQSLEVFPSLVPTTNIFAGMRSTEDWQGSMPAWESSFILNDLNAIQDTALEYPTDIVAESNGAITNRPYQYNLEAADMFQGVSNSSQLPDATPAALCIQTPFYEFVYIKSKPAEFLAIRETQGFRDMAINLRTTNENCPYAPAISIYYNPKKETITLTGSKSAIEKAKTRLQDLLETFSRQWGVKYLVTSRSGSENEPRNFRRDLLGSQDAHCNANSEKVKGFPIIPKNDKLLARLWFKHLLPALPQFLEPILGGDYTASLVRRGRSKLHALPCIQIESPYVPGLPAQELIKASLNQICEKEHHPHISIRFVQGSIKKLNGGEEDDTDEPGESAASQRRRFNFVRPCSRPGMGASLGLLCSKKVSATLGGYIVMDGEKYMLTSDHFVETSEEPANSDRDDANRTLTSPSRYDLNDMENCLKQSKREMDSEIDSLTQRIHGDRDIPEDFLDDQNLLTPELHDMVARNKDITSLLGQVTKSPLEYAVGTVFESKLTPRSAPISESLAKDLQLDTLMLNYHMDWALCSLNCQTGENRHKYSSPQDAMVDNYIEERDRRSQPGDVCYKTCEPEWGTAVYYVGQGSDHRSGVVNIPMLVSTGYTKTHAWAIMDSQGKHIEYSHVAGDSGAWVIRRNGNELMGQVHAFGNGGQVLFAPIKVIFDDLEESYGHDVVLPPASPGSGLVAIEARPLCAVQSTPPVRPYRFLSAPSASATRPKKPLVDMSLSESSVNKSLGGNVILSRTDSITGLEHSSPSCDSSSSLPLLTDSSQSPETTVVSLQSFGSPGDAELATGHCENWANHSKSLRTLVDKTTECEIPHLSLDERSEEQMVALTPRDVQFKAQFLFRVILNPRATTWPIDNGSNFARARTVAKLSQRHQEFSRSRRGCFNRLRLL